MSDAVERARPPGGSGSEILPRRLGMLALILMIYAFNAPVVAMAGYLQLSVAFGNGIGAPGAFLISGAILLVFAVGFVGMSRYSPNPGAYYRYVVDGLGKAPGLAAAFLAGIAYMMMAAGSFFYLGVIILDMTKRLFGTEVLNWQVWSLVALAVITLLGLLRVDLSMRVLGTLVLVECVVVAAWELMIFVLGGPEGYVPQAWSPGEVFSGSIGVSVLFAIGCLIGIEAAACFRDETRNPDRNVSRATYLGIASLAIFYALGAWAYIISQGSSKVVEVATTDPVGSFVTSIDTYLGVVFVNIVTVTLITSQLAATNTLLGMSSRYLYALGRDRVLTARLAKVHPRLQSPYVAVLTVVGICLATLVMVMVAGTDVVLAYAGLAAAGTYFVIPLFIAVSIAVIAFFRRHPEHDRGPWVSVIAPVLSAVVLAILFVLITQNLEMLAGGPIGALAAEIGVVVVIVGGLLLGLHYKRNKPEVYARIGNPLE